jgi:hypothetical protein
MLLSACSHLRTPEQQAANADWPSEYINNFTGRAYRPHHELEQVFVYQDGPWRYGLCKGGEGSGKSVAGVIKTLERLRRGMNGIMVSPDLPHFKKSLWPEFKRWCPWPQVVESQQYRGQGEWEPHEPFTLTFKNGAQLICGGIENPASFEGPNVSFAHLDEARRLKTAEALKVLDGRVRIPGRDGEHAQIWFTTTPKKHWLYEYFGPPLEDSPDPRESFKRRTYTLTLSTLENERAGNLEAGFTESRASSLNDAERRVLLEAAWEDIDDVERFLTTMLWWDACLDPQLPPFDPREPMILGADAGIKSDCFGLVGVCRHPLRRQDVVIRYSRVWVPRPGQPVSLTEVEQEILDLVYKHNWHIVKVVFDPSQLELMMERIFQAGIYTEPFNQGVAREIADKQFLDLVMGRQVAHDGSHHELRQHIDNADRKLSGHEGEGKMRVVKRVPSLKVDLLVAAVMAANRCLDLNL